MTARVVQDQGRLFIQAPLSAFQAAGMFLSLPTSNAEVRMGHTNRAEAERLAQHLTDTARMAADASMLRAAALSYRRPPNPVRPIWLSSRQKNVVLRIRMGEDVRAQDIKPQRVLFELIAKGVVDIVATTNRVIIADSTALPEACP